MATIQKNRSAVKQPEACQTSAAIERHLLHLGAAGTLYEDLARCKRTRTSCARNLMCETPPRSRKKRFSLLEHYHEGAVPAETLVP